MQPQLYNYLQRPGLDGPSFNSPSPNDSGYSDEQRYEGAVRQAMDVDSQKHPEGEAHHFDLEHEVAKILMLQRVRTSRPSPISHGWVGSKEEGPVVPVDEPDIEGMPVGTDVTFVPTFHGKHSNLFIPNPHAERGRGW